MIILAAPLCTFFSCSMFFLVCLGLQEQWQRGIWQQLWDTSLAAWLFRGATQTLTTENHFGWEMWQRVGNKGIMAPTEPTIRPVHKDLSDTLSYHLLCLLYLCQLLTLLFFETLPSPEGWGHAHKGEDAVATTLGRTSLLLSSRCGHFLGRPSQCPAAGRSQGTDRGFSFHPS